ncbi:Transcription factor HES-7 [Nibea albiflora]|uniref:Transcription factor HES-7 n=1 Tax=Nibea albiflora TaxID=240163 RepID=A0ACB7ERF3_NIBAL|nr:Transcription factor HES-7 [Nibea albiflora]
MTRKLQNTTMEDGRSRKRVLKPVVEKKRRDRINQSLAELRSLLLNHTSDPRLQNPKIEKAEILDFAVEYLQKRTDGKMRSDDSAHTQMKTHPLVVNPHHSEPSAAARFTMESAGFQQCVAQLTSYMQKITPSQRTSLIEGLKCHTESQQPKPDFSQRTTGDRRGQTAICGRRLHNREERRLSQVVVSISLPVSAPLVLHTMPRLSVASPLSVAFSLLLHIRHLASFPVICLSLHLPSQPVASVFQHLLLQFPTHRPTLRPSCPSLPPSTPCTERGVTTKLLLNHVEALVLMERTRD